MIDQFGRKRCQKKRRDVDYKFLQEFFQKYFVVHEQSAVENSFSTYVCYAPDGLFWLNLYQMKRSFVKIVVLHRSQRLLASNHLWISCNRTSYIVVLFWCHSKMSCDSWKKRWPLALVPWPWSFLYFPPSTSTLEKIGHYVTAQRFSHKGR